MSSRKQKRLLQWLSTKKQESSDFPASPAPEKTENTSSSCYLSINECPLKAFIQADVHGNYAALVKSNNPDADEQAAAFFELKSQFAAAMGSQAYLLFSQIFRDITTLRQKYDTVIQFVRFVRTTFEIEKVYSPRFGKFLNDLLVTDFRFDPKDSKAFRGLLQRCEKRAKAFLLRADLLESDFQAMQNKEEKGEPATEEYYLSVLIQLSNYAKYEVSDRITVFEFCYRVNQVVAANNRLRNMR